MVEVVEAVGDVAEGEEEVVLEVGDNAGNIRTTDSRLMRW